MEFVHSPLSTSRKNELFNAKLRELRQQKDGINVVPTGPLYAILILYRIFKVQIPVSESTMQFVTQIGI